MKNNSIEKNKEIKKEKIKKNNNIFKRMNSFLTNKYFLFFLFIVSFSFVVCLIGGIGDSDPYWHTTLGKYILQHKSIPKTDIFSWFSKERGFTQICHSWLGSIIIYLYTVVFKNTDIALIIFKIVNILLCSYIITVKFKEISEMSEKKENGESKQTSLFVVIPMVISAQLLIRCFINPRPLAIGNILFLIAFLILDKINSDNSSKKSKNDKKDRKDRKDRKYVYLLGFISLLIANIHGGALVMLIGITGIYFIAQYFPDFIRYIKRCNNISKLENKEKVFISKTENTFKKIVKKVIEDIKHLPKMEKSYEKTGMAIILEVLLGMINPYGPRVLFYAFFDEDSLAMSIISEWKPSDLFDTIIVIALILAVFIIYYFGKKNGKKDKDNKKIKIENSFIITFPHLLLLAIFFFMTARHSRMSQYLLIVILLCIFDVYPIVNSYLLQIDSAQKLLTKTLKTKGLFTCFMLILLAFGLTAASYESTTSDAPFKNEVVEYLKGKSYKRLYTAYNDGGLLIYHGIDSFIDSRSDPFPSDELVKASGFATLSSEYFTSSKDVKDYLNKYNFDAILLYKTRDGAAISYLDESKDWIKVYEDVDKSADIEGKYKDKSKNDQPGFVVFEKAVK